jgi:predicted phage tail protein
MQTVHLNGSIAKFGEVWHTDCFNIRDVFKLIECQTPGFRKYILDSAEAGVEYEIKRGGDFLDYQEELLISLNDDDVIITEVPAGSKSGKGKLLFAALLVASFFIPGSQGFLTNSLTGTATVEGAAAGSIASSSTTIITGLSGPGMIVASIATNLAMTGIAQIMAPGPETDKNTDESYLFDGPTNAITQGMPVPLAYGELIVGGAPISQSYEPIINTYDSRRYGSSVAIANAQENADTEIDKDGNVDTDVGDNSNTGQTEEP